MSRLRYQTTTFVVGPEIDEWLTRQDAIAVGQLTAIRAMLEPRADDPWPLNPNQLPKHQHLLAGARKVVEL